MRSDTSSSSSGDGLRLSSEGAETELYRSAGAQVYLVDVEASVLMQTGDFSFSLANHAVAPLAALVAMVGDLQWPVGKDSPAMKVADKCFTYALHGLIYGLVLGELTTAAEIEKLEEILQKYATFEVVDSEIATEVEHKNQNPVAAGAQADYWTRVAASLESRSARIARRSVWWGSGRTIARGALSSVERGEGGGGVSPTSLRTRMQQMRRVSAVAKLFTKALVKGMIRPSSHVEVWAGGGEGTGEVAVASVDAVTKVVEAVEVSGSEWVRRRCADQSAVENSDAGGSGGGGDSSHVFVWTLSNLGLRMLYGASTTLIKSGSMSRSSSDSSATSSGGGARLLSSSSSTSNSASPPPFPPSSNNQTPPPPASSNASPPPLPPLPATLFRQPPPPPPTTTTSLLHRPTPARPASTLQAARRPPPFLPPPPRPRGDHHSPR